MVPLARRGAHIRPVVGQQRGERFVVSFIGYAEVLENLANAPSVRLGMPRCSCAASIGRTIAAIRSRVSIASARSCWWSSRLW